MFKILKVAIPLFELIAKILIFIILVFYMNIEFLNPSPKKFDFVKEVKTTQSSKKYWAMHWLLHSFCIVQLVGALLIYKDTDNMDKLYFSGTQRAEVLLQNIDKNNFEDFYSNTKNTLLKGTILDTQKIIMYLDESISNPQSNFSKQQHEKILNLIKEYKYLSTDKAYERLDYVKNNCFINFNSNLFASCWIFNFNDIQKLQVNQKNTINSKVEALENNFDKYK